MLKDLIIENESRIEAFHLDYYKTNQNYPILAALSALNTTNEIQKSYFKEPDKDEAFNVLKLYAFLQSLFVSIDSLYALAYCLTKSKSIININKNPILRELKYIRNDVVGHPANRIYDQEVLAYCILNTTSVKKDSFSYEIYSKNGVQNKDVDLLKLVESYYIESNHLLGELKSVSEENIKSSYYATKLLEALNLFDMKMDYMESIKEIKESYQRDFPQASSSQHRVLWRIELIEELKKFQSEDANVMDLAEYAIGLEILKLYQLITNRQYEVSLRRKKPVYISSFYRFLKKNPEAVEWIQRIYDLKNPLIKDAFLKLSNLAKQKNQVFVIQYLNLLVELYQKKEDSLLYALALPIKEYSQLK